MSLTDDFAEKQDLRCFGEYTVLQFLFLTFGIKEDVRKITCRWGEARRVSTITYSLEDGYSSEGLGKEDCVGHLQITRMHRNSRAPSNGVSREQA